MIIGDKGLNQEQDFKIKNIEMHVKDITKEE